MGLTETRSMAKVAFSTFIWSMPGMDRFARPADPERFDALSNRNAALFFARSVKKEREGP